jgi:hypothetical protein
VNLKQRVVKDTFVLPGICEGSFVSVHAINMYEGGGQTPLILNLGCRWDELLASATERFTLGK